jgi:DNA-binding PadR family transcriptional regulator
VVFLTATILSVQRWPADASLFGLATLYPLLHSLEEQGYLARENRVGEGRVRKYYVITHEGSAALQEAKQKIAELVHEVLEEEDDVRLPELPPSFEEEAEEG